MPTRRICSLASGSITIGSPNCEPRWRIKRLDVLISYTPENIYYLSGYQTPGYYTYQCVIVPVEGDPIMFTRYLEETNVRGLSWIDTRDYYNDNQSPVEETIRTLTEHGLTDKTIGVEENSWFLTVSDYRRLQEGLPGATFVDASGTVEQLRLIKSDQEVAYIRQAAGRLRRRNVDACHRYRRAWQDGERSRLGALCGGIGA